MTKFQILKRIVPYILFILCFFSVIYLFVPSLEQNACEQYDNFKKGNFEGIVVIKAIDTPNHGYPYIQLEPDIGKIYFELDINGVFDSLEVNDEITKLPKSDLLKVIRGGKLHYWEVDYGCK